MTDNPIIGWLLIGWFTVTGCTSLLIVPAVFKLMAQQPQPQTVYQYDIEVNQSETNTNDCRFLTWSCAK